MDNLKPPESVAPLAPKSTEYLNAFRGLAAFWVLAAHCCIWTGYRHVPNPKMAVDLFMILSGFLMAYTVSARESREPMTRSSSWLVFYVRRFFRIAPLYYFVLLFLIFEGDAFKNGLALIQQLNLQQWAGDTNNNPALTHYDATNLALHASFLFGLSPFYSSSTLLPDWSLSLEMQFYAVFPAIFLLTKRYGVVRTCAVLGALSLVLHFFFHRYLPFREPSALPLKLPSFLIGILIFEADRRRGDRRNIIALIAFLSFAQFLTYRAYMPLMWVLVAALYLLWTEKGLENIRAALDNRLTRFASDVSYSVYLVHGFAISFLGSHLYASLLAHDWPRPVATAAVAVSVIPASYGVAYLTHKYVELPGIAGGKYVIGRLASREAQSVSLQA